MKEVGVPLTGIGREAATLLEPAIGNGAASAAASPITSQPHAPNTPHLSLTRYQHDCLEHMFTFATGRSNITHRDSVAVSNFRCEQICVTTTDTCSNYGIYYGASLYNEMLCNTGARQHHSTLTGCKHTVPVGQLPGSGQKRLLQGHVEVSRVQQSACSEYRCKALQSFRMD